MSFAKSLRTRAAPIVRLTTRALDADAMPIADLKRELARFRIRPVVPMGKVAGYRFTKFGPGGGSPHQRLAAAFLKTGSHAELRQVLTEHLENYRPRTLAETLFSRSDPPLHPLTDLHPLTKLHPWDPIMQVSTGYLGQGDDTFGPVSSEKVDREVDRFVRSIESIVQHGYRPDAHKRGFISGYMVFCDGDYRFVVRNGLHRLGALAALGVTELRVGLTDHRPAVADADEMESWVHVRSGLCSRALALCLVRRYFDERHR